MRTTIFFMFAMFALIASGCGQTNVLTGAALTAPGSAGVSARINTPQYFQPAAQVESCDPNRTLQLMIVFEGTMLKRDFPVADLSADESLPAFDAEQFGVTPVNRPLLIDSIISHVADAFEPLNIEVVSDEPDSLKPLHRLETGATTDSNRQHNAEIISQVILTQWPDMPQHCGCQGMTPTLGLPASGTAQAIVFANAFVDNGFAAAIAPRSYQQKIEMTAVALANSIVHEAGHTLGLVHIDVPGPPKFFMARGGSSSLKLSLESMTTPQTFTSDDYPTTPDAVGVRLTQCGLCLLTETIEARRRCTQ